DCSLLTRCPAPRSPCLRRLLLDFHPEISICGAATRLFHPGNGFMTDFAANNNRTPEDDATAADPAQVAAAALAAENAELKDRALRARAEMENLRRRTEREVADSRTYAITSFARDLVGVADNIQRALDAVRDSGVALEGPTKALVDGVELTERELLKVMEKN